MCGAWFLPCLIVSFPFSLDDFCALGFSSTCLLFLLRWVRSKLEVLNGRTTGSVRAAAFLELLMVFPGWGSPNTRKSKSGVDPTEGDREVRKASKLHGVWVVWVVIHDQYKLVHGIDMLIFSFVLPLKVRSAQQSLLISRLLCLPNSNRVRMSLGGMGRAWPWGSLRYSEGVLSKRAGNFFFSELSILFTDVIPLNATTLACIGNFFR
jgi:hypothetical protein